jgi:hypothetical protein
MMHILSTQVGSPEYDVAVRVAVGPRGGVYVVGQMGTENPLESARAFLGRWDYLGNQQASALFACVPICLVRSGSKKLAFHFF